METCGPFDTSAVWSGNHEERHTVVDEITMCLLEWDTLDKPLVYVHMK